MLNFVVRAALVLVCAGTLSALNLEDFRGNSRGKRQNTCTAEFAKMRPHTMCKHDVGQPSELTYREQIKIVQLHNKYRGNARPSAADLTKMVWDSGLAEVAAKWARQCVWDHDPHDHRAMPGWGISIGQNMAKGHRSWEDAINDWQAEVKDYRYGVDPDTYVPPDIMIGHYTQMVQSNAHRLGCGEAICYGVPFYVCNYAAGQSQMERPYALGRPCSACRRNCWQNKLCDCRGKVCKHRGTLDVSTCRCNCTELYSGPDCNILNCPRTDKGFCGMQDFIPENCKVFYNIPTDCPYMCGICGDCKGRYCKNGGTLDPSNCQCRCPPQYEGRSCERVKCPQRDKDICGRGDFTPENCDVFFNIPTDCPYMCGECGNCKGIVCQNGGTLEPSSCSCRCNKMYRGRYCEHFICPRQDKPMCRRPPFVPANCNVYINVPTDCPYMCGLCRSNCKGIVCQNGGTLEPSSCSCQCNKMYRGRYCEHFICPRQDKPTCRQPPLVPANCNVYINVPTICPYMCGLCR